MGGLGNPGMAGQQGMAGQPPPLAPEQLMAFLTLLMQQSANQQPGQEQQQNMPAPQQINGQTAAQAPMGLQALIPAILAHYGQTSQPAQQQQAQQSQQAQQQQQANSPVNMLNMILSSLGSRLG